MTQEFVSSRHSDAAASPPSDDRGRRRHLTYVIALGVLQTLSTFTIDIYLPAFPRIASSFGVPESSIQLTFTGAMAGMMIGQLVAGPWSDSVGRRRPMLIATTIHVLASVACAMAPHVEILIIARVLQGAASASTGVLAIAMVRDLYSGLRMMRMLASMAMISGMAIAAGPLLGSLLLTITSWRGVFGSLATYGLLLGLAVVFLIGETLPSDHRHGQGIRRRVARFGTVLRDRSYVGLVLVTSFVWTGMYGYLSASSFLFQNVHRLSERGYGLVFASHALFMLAGTQLAVRVTRWLEPRAIVTVSTAGLLLSAAALLITAQTIPDSLIGLLVPLWAFTFFIGVNTPCIQTLALTRHGQDAGTAASLLNATRQGFGAIATSLAGIVGLTSPTPVATLMVCGQVLSVLALWIIVRPRRLDRLREL